MDLPKPIILVIIVACVVLGFVLGAGVVTAMQSPSDPTPTTMTPDERYVLCLNTLNKVNANGNLDDLDPRVLSCHPPKE